MVTKAALTIERNGDAAGSEAPAPRPKRPRAPRKTAAQAAKPAKAAPPKPTPRRGDGPWMRAFTAGFWVALVALGAAAALSIRAGHAPSWRSLSVVCLQALPLWPGMMLFWRLLEGFRSRFAATPLALWLGVALIGAALTMLIAPGIVFAIHSRSLVMAEDLDGELTLWQHLLGLTHAFSLYVTTAFRLWWPWGALIPVMVAALFWRAQRRI